VVETQTRFRMAVARDAAAIVQMVNAANSGDGGATGWTHEVDLFEGMRTDVAEIRDLLATPGSRFVLCVDGGEIIGCAYVRQLGDAACMGPLAVRPLLQSRGVGSALIAECERLARGLWRSPRMVISVITSHRPELTAFYERRGFRRTGRYKEFESMRARKGPKVRGLALEWMEKELSDPGHATGHDVAKRG